MSRIGLVCSLVVALVCGLASAQEKKEERPNKAIATVIKSDADKHTITVKWKNKEGKEEEKTLEVKDKIKLIGEDGKVAAEADFFKGLVAGEELLVLVAADGKVTEIRDLPPRGAKPEEKGTRTVASFVSVKEHTLTLKMKNKDGKEEELKVEIKEGVKLVGEDGKEHTEKEFLQDLTVGEEVVVVTKDGKVVEIRDLPAAKKP